VSYARKVKDEGEQNIYFKQARLPTLPCVPVLDLLSLRELLMIAKFTHSA